MHRYKAHGLSIRSEFLLPELVVGEERADLVIRRGNLGHSQKKMDAAAFKVWAADCGVYMCWSNRCTLLVRDGKEIIVDADASFQDPDIRLLVLGPAMGMALLQRGLSVLHASSVVVNDKPVAFLGASRAGKSTIAATFYRRGHPVLADDITVLGLANGHAPLVYPAFPRIKLWPDAVVSLGDDVNAVPRLCAFTEKRSCQVTNGFALRPISLNRIYVLDNGPSIQIEPLQPREAVLQLIRNSYARRFASDLLRSQEGTELLQYAEIAKMVPVYRLSRPRDLQLLSNVAELVEDHLA